MSSDKKIAEIKKRLEFNRVFLQVHGSSRPPKEVEDIEFLLSELEKTRDRCAQQEVVLLQYSNLRKHFSQLISDILGPNYYNEGMDVYHCDELTCRDLKSKIKRR